MGTGQGKAGYEFAREALGPRVEDVDVEWPVPCPAILPRVAAPVPMNPPSTGSTGPRRVRCSACDSTIRRRRARSSGPAPPTRSSCGTIVDHLGADPRDLTFVDFGSGKGHAALRGCLSLQTHHRRRMVLGSVRVARRNIAVFRSRHPSAPGIEVQEMNVLDFDAAPAMKAGKL
jgi:hypothetical protein